MSFQELVREFINEPGKITPEKCESLLRSLGYEPHKKAGSERAFHKKGTTPIIFPIPHGEKYIKSFYIRRIIRQLDLEGYLEDG